MAGKRRSEADRIAELESRIAHLKARMDEKKVKKDPALKHVAKAVMAIDLAAGETRDVPLRNALESARSILAACLSLTGVVVPQQARKSRSSGGSAGVDAETLLRYVRENPGRRGEQISTALGTTSDAMRPTMKQLIEDGRVKVSGQRRATSYSPA
jgi:hypothetical protein